MLNWTEISEPKRDVSFYTHTIAETPLGKFVIEWKSWKDDPDYSILLNDIDYIGTEYSLEAAKTTVDIYIKAKINELQSLYDNNNAQEQ